MAKELLPDQELQEGRYVVLKTLSFGDEGGVYLVKRNDGSRWVLKEIIPPKIDDEEKLERRSFRFREAMDALTNFDHPNLSKIVEHFSEGPRKYIVMERVEGITLGQLTEMGVNPHPEEQVMKWGLILCDALHYMHDRPQPFIFDVLEPSHIMITPEKNLKLINYGLDRFFIDDEDDEFGTGAEYAARDMQRFAETMAYLLTKKPPGPLGVGQQDNVSPELAKIINRALTGDIRRTFASFDEVAKLLDRVLHPPPPVETVVSKKTWLKSVRWDLSYTRIFQNLFFKFLQQPLWLAMAEIAGLLLLLGALWMVTHPAVERRTVPAVYVACGGELWAVATGNRSVFTRIRLPEKGVCLAATPAGDRLFVSASESNRLLVYNSVTNHMLGYVQVDQGPGPLAMDPRGEFLFVLHPTTGQVGMVGLEQSPPKPVEQDSMGRLKSDRLVSIVAVGRQPEGMSLDPDLPTPAAGETPAPPPTPLPGQAAARKLKLYVSNRGEGQVGIYEPSPPARLASVPVTEPGANLLTPDRKTLFVASPGRNRIHVFSVGARGTLRERKILEQIGGKEPVALLLSSSGELWCVNASGSLGIINVELAELRKTVELDGKPTAAAFVEKGQDLELWVALGDKGQIAIVDPESRLVDENIQVGANPTSLCVVK
ncbi:MAG: hypothetical protein HY319_31675 [Armatimonadetes bacterium]|nr:hypothetical protein [Armatimonadota bacterium]